MGVFKHDFLHSPWHGVDQVLEAAAVGHSLHSEDSYMLYLATKENLCINLNFFLCLLEPAIKGLGHDIEFKYFDKNV